MAYKVIAIINDVGGSPSTSGIFATMAEAEAAAAEVNKDYCNFIGSHIFETDEAVDTCFIVREE